MASALASSFRAAGRRVVRGGGGVPSGAAVWQRHRRHAPLLLLLPPVRGLGLSYPRAHSQLTPQEVSMLLRANEVTFEEDVCAGAVKSFDMNTLGSNWPTEDAHAEAVLHNGKGMMFSIIDGHGGPSCGQVTAKRLLQYVAAGLLSPETLKLHLRSWREQQQQQQQQLSASNSSSSKHGLDPDQPAKADEEEDFYRHLITIINDDSELVKDLQWLYQQSYLRHVENLSDKADASAAKNEEPISKEEKTSDVGFDSDIPDRLRHAFLAFDNHLSSEATTPTEHQDIKKMTLAVAQSGAVAVVAYIDAADLYVAGTGDCAAVLGSLSENETWVATRMSTDHNSDNVNEVKRLEAEHPGESMRDIIRGDRLLGMLAPLRAFGDFRFKWPADLISKWFGPEYVPEPYKTPPYLSADPEVFHRRLSPKDKFLVIGSDGLWDMMTPMQVIRLVGEHMSGKMTLTPLNLSAKDNLKLSEIKKMLEIRQQAMKLKPVDTNAATHLIRNALGGTAYGVDHGRLSQMLSLPPDMVRMFRDDITVTVVFFDPDYFKQN